MEINKKNPKGFTIIEMMLSIAIIVLISTIVLNFVTDGLTLSRFESEQETAVKIARDAMAVVTKEIRKANQSELGGYPILTIEDFNFIFFSDVDNDNETEKIRYYLNGNELIKSITEPGADSLYAGADSTSTIANYMNNQAEPIFRYYDSDQNETSEINDIRMININLKINVTPTIMPNDYYVETDINLRNLKDNL